MIIAGIYSFNGGREVIEAQYGVYLNEVMSIIRSVDGSLAKTKSSAEKTMTGRSLYSSRALNKAFESAFVPRGWTRRRESCDYSSEHYTPEYHLQSTFRGAFREMDFVKDRVGVEV